MRKISGFTLFKTIMVIIAIVITSMGEGLAAAKPAISPDRNQIYEPQIPGDPPPSTIVYIPFAVQSPPKQQQRQQEDVQLTLSDTSVRPGEPVTVTVTNDSSIDIATFDHKSLCSIFTIQQMQEEENWVEVLPCSLVEKTKPVVIPPGESSSLEFNGGSHFQDPGAIDPGVYRVELMYKSIEELGDLISEEIPWQFAYSPPLTVTEIIPLSGLPEGGRVDENLGIQGPFVSDPVTPRVFDGDLRDLPTGDLQVSSANEPLQFNIPNPNFDGLFNPPGTFITPPDTVADVGPNHVIQAVNVSYVIYDKQGNLLVGPFNINSLWAGFGGLCETQNDGDPYVLYDHLADRWVLSQFVVFTNQCIAVSQTPDPVTGGWFLYDFSTGGVTNDYPKLSLWPDAYYMGSQRGFLPAMTFGSDAWAFDRANMLLGNPATQVSFFDPGAFMLPSDLDGDTLPPAGAPNIFARVVDGAQFGGVDRLEFRAFSVNFAMPLSSTFTPLPDLPTAAFDRDLCGFSLMGNCIPQPGGVQVLESLTAWLMSRLQYRNFGTHETLVVNHTVDVDGTDHAGIRWYELRRSGAGPWTIFQQADYSPDIEHRWMGSIAMDRNGNMALGYSVSSNAVFSSLRYAGRLAGDPPGTLPQGEFTLIAGNGAQTASNRWGDYSAMNLDPEDDCTFWFTSEYYPVSSPVSWSTRIGAFRFETCETDLSITKSDSPDPVIAGSNLNYTLTITNNGPGDATGVMVTDALPAGVTFVSATPSQGSCTGSVTCDLGDLANGASATIMIEVTVDPTTPSGTITNTASVTGNETDPNPGNNTASEDTTVQVEVEKALTIDFEGLSAGSIVNSVSVGSGIRVEPPDGTVSGSVSVFGINPQFSQNAAMIYDSTNPTGEDDDLAGFMGNKNLLIVSEDLDSTDPDDNKGGTFDINFSNFGPGQVTIQSLEVFDIDPNEAGGTIVVEKIDGSTLTTNIPITGNKAKGTVSILNAESVKRMIITLKSSGAIDEIKFLVKVIQ